jgi:hypothetical protein
MFFVGTFGSGQIFFSEMKTPERGKGERALCRLLTIGVVKLKPTIIKEISIYYR